MNLTIYECVNETCRYVTREINLLQEFKTYIIAVILLSILLLIIHLRYKYLQKKGLK